jgi:hypothetical protein
MEGSIVDRNVTVKLDETLLRKARQAAVSDDKSLSQWISDLIIRTLSTDAAYARSRQRALRRIKSGWKLGGSPLSRDAAHER